MNEKYSNVPSISCVTVVSCVDGDSDTCGVAAIMVMGTSFVAIVVSANVSYAITESVYLPGLSYCHAAILSIFRNVVSPSLKYYV